MSRSVDPASPPQTPVTASPVSRHKLVRGLHSPHGHHLHRQNVHPVPAQLFTKPISQHAKLPPVIGGPNGLPFRPNLYRPDDLSPRSAGSSPTINEGDYSDDADEDDDDEDDEDEYDEDEYDEDDEDDDDDFDNDEVDMDPDSSSSGTASSPLQPSYLPRQTPGAVPPPGGTKILEVPQADKAPETPPATTTATTTATTMKTTTTSDGKSPAFAVLVEEETLVIEEISDYDSGDMNLQVLRPHAIEEPESERARSLTPTPERPHAHHHHPKPSVSSPPPHGLSFSFPNMAPPDMERSVVNGLESLTCGTEESAVDDNYDDSDFDEAGYNLFLLKQRADKRRRRMTSGSISKRTISESIGSDTDTEDLTHLQTLLDISEVGSSARRLRRRIDRHSLQFSDPPPPRIDELEEPDTTDNDDDDGMFQDGEDLARELPYYTLEYISMEVDSP